MKKEIKEEEALKIVDDMYQKRWEECGVDDGNTIHMGNLDKLQYNELEKASILLLRTELRLQQENKKLKEQLEASERARKEAIEYLTSYKSISEIQGIDDVEENKKLDEKTMNEMIRRYLNVHDKTLEILDIDKGE